MNITENKQISEKETLVESEASGDQSEKLLELLDMIENTGSIEYCKEEIEKRSVLAKGCLNDLNELNDDNNEYEYKDNEIKGLLSDYLDYILEL